MSDATNSELPKTSVVFTSYQETLKELMQILVDFKKALSVPEIPLTINIKEIFASTLNKITVIETACKKQLQSSTPHSSNRNDKYHSGIFNLANALEDLRDSCISDLQDPSTTPLAETILTFIGNINRIQEKLPKPSKDSRAKILSFPR